MLARGALALAFPLQLQYGTRFTVESLRGSRYSATLLKRGDADSGLYVRLEDGRIARLNPNRLNLETLRRVTDGGRTEEETLRAGDDVLVELAGEAVRGQFVQTDGVYLIVLVDTERRWLQLQDVQSVSLMFRASDIKAGDAIVVRSRSGNEYEGRVISMEPRQALLELKTGKRFHLRLQRIAMDSLQVLIPLPLETVRRQGERSPRLEPPPIHDLDSDVPEVPPTIAPMRGVDSAPDVPFAAVNDLGPAGSSRFDPLDSAELTAPPAAISQSDPAEILDPEPLEDVPPTQAIRRDGGLQLPEGGGPRVQLERGFKVGSYAVVREIGRGSMATVYLAEHELLGSLAAVKLMNLELVEDPEAYARFEREMRTLARLSDAPGVVRVLDAGRTRWQQPYYAMEYVPGRSLLAALKAGKIDLSGSLDVLEQACEGLAYAHDRGIVHRDVKPSNILLSDLDRRARMADFGLTRLIRAGADSASLTQTGTILGTPAYMAPEQICHDLGEVGPRSDVFALGAVLFHLMIGEAPFAHFSVPQLVEYHTERKAPPRPRDRRPDLPAELESVCLRAMAPRADGRFPDGRAFLEALRRARGKASRPGSESRPGF